MYSNSIHLTVSLKEIDLSLEIGFLFSLVLIPSTKTWKPLGSNPFCVIDNLKSNVDFGSSHFVFHFGRSGQEYKIQ